MTRRVALRTPRALPLVLALAAACVRPMVPSDYEPSPGAARLDADQARDHLSAALAPECRRLVAAGTIPTGEARVTVQVTQAGEVTRARLTQRTGEARIDELFGATAARMRFDADTTRPASFPGRLRMGYSCAAGVAVGTIELF